MRFALPLALLSLLGGTLGAASPAADGVTLARDAFAGSLQATYRLHFDSPSTLTFTFNVDATDEPYVFELLRVDDPRYWTGDAMREEYAGGDAEVRTGGSLPPEDVQELLLPNGGHALSMTWTDYQDHTQDLVAIVAGGPHVTGSLQVDDGEGVTLLAATHGRASLTRLRDFDSAADADALAPPYIEGVHLNVEAEHTERFEHTAWFSYLDQAVGGRVALNGYLGPDGPVTEPCVSANALLAGAAFGDCAYEGWMLAPGTYTFFSYADACAGLGAEPWLVAADIVFPAAQA
jgi:hypothetical protein